jgi:hypothetical protein
MARDQPRDGHPERKRRTLRSEADEGHRYDPELVLQSWNLLLALFHRRLGFGDLDIESDGAQAESRH